MRIFLHITVIALICAAGNLAVLQHFGWGRDQAWSSDHISRLIGESTSDLTPIGKVDSFRNLSEADQERISLARLLPDALSFDRIMLADLIAFRESCDKSLMRRPGDPRLRKAFVFTTIICGHETEAESFFVSPPYIHPLGTSFVLRAHLEAPKKYPVAWLTEHRAYLHAVERQRYVPEAAADPSPLESLTTAERRFWTNSAALLRADDEIWKLTSAPHDMAPSESSYQRYRLADVNDSLSRHGLMLDPEVNGNTCLAEGAGFCVREDRRAGKFRSWALRGLSVSLFVVSLSLLILGLQWMIARARARRERVMILQTLAHELRTPVTSLGLTVELLRGEFDRLSAEGQAGYLRMADDLRRLKRLVEGSRDYLSSDSVRRYEKQPIDLGPFLENFAAQYEGRISFRGMQERVDVRSHPYWLGICLSNLVDNALKHGRAPVVLTVVREKNKPVICVEDGGAFSRKEFLRLRGEFKRGSDSRGSGLGLAIVTETLRKLGHKLEFAETPTRFLITLEEA